MREVLLTNGMKAKVDDEDYDLVKDTVWYPCQVGKMTYAISEDGVFMHDLIAAAAGMLDEHYGNSRN